MLRLRFKELFAIYYELNRKDLSSEFFMELKNFLTYDSQYDEKIARRMNINNSELVYLKNICIEQLTLNCDRDNITILNESDNSISMRFYNKYLNDYVSGRISLNKEIEPTNIFYYMDDDSLEDMFNYFYTKIIDKSAKYIPLEKEKECIYDILEALIKYTGEYDYIVDVLNEIYEQFVLEDEEDEDEYIPTKEEIEDMFNNCYNDIVSALYKNYPDKYERDKFVNFFIAICYATGKIRNHYIEGQCIIPYMLESVREIDISRLDKALIIAFLQDYYEMCFINEGINFGAINTLKSDAVLEVYKKIDFDIYEKHAKNNYIVFTEPLWAYIDSIISRKYNLLNNKYAYDKLIKSGVNPEEVYNTKPAQPTNEEIKGFLYEIYRNILSYDIFNECEDVEFDDRKKAYLRTATIRRIIAIFFEAIHYNTSRLNSEYKKVYEDLLNGVYKNDKELTELFIKYGYSMIQIYFNMIKDPKLLDLCQNKIYNDNLIEFITTIDPTSTIELLNRIDNRNIESIMNCSNLIQAISNENFITKDEFTKLIKELGISETDAIGSIITIVYENMLYSEHKDTEITFLIEHNSLQDIVKILFEHDELFLKMIRYFKKYAGKDFNADKELEHRKNIKVKQKEHVISRINPFYKAEQHTFK